LIALAAALPAQSSRPATAEDAREAVRTLLLRCVGPFEGKLTRSQLRVDKERPKEAQIAALDLPGRLRLEQVLSGEAPGPRRR
jgi:hypothetical protein